MEEIICLIIHINERQKYIYVKVDNIYIIYTMWLFLFIVIIDEKFKAKEQKERINIK